MFYEIDRDIYIVMDNIPILLFVYFVAFTAVFAV